MIDKKTLTNIFCVAAICGLMEWPSLKADEPKELSKAWVDIVTKWSANENECYDAAGYTKERFGPDVIGNVPEAVIVQSIELMELVVRPAWRPQALKPVLHAG